MSAPLILSEGVSKKWSFLGKEENLVVILGGGGGGGG